MQRRTFAKRCSKSARTVTDRGGDGSSREVSRTVGTPAAAMAAGGGLALFAS